MYVFLKRLIEQIWDFKVNVFALTLRKRENQGVKFSFRLIFIHIAMAKWARNQIKRSKCQQIYILFHRWVISSRKFLSLSLSLFLLFTVTIIENVYCRLSGLRIAFIFLNSSQDEFFFVVFFIFYFCFYFWNIQK